MRIALKVLDPDIEAPSLAHIGDAGLDLRTTIDFTLYPGNRVIVPCGFAIAIPEGYAGLVIPRSGLAAKHGITVVNAPGLIDSNYRGEIKVILANTDSASAFSAMRGDRVAQLTIIQVPDVELYEVSALPDTQRGSDGLGSSGIR